jgi:hypothetical protein
LAGLDDPMSELYEPGPPTSSGLRQTALWCEERLIWRDGRGSTR